MSTFRKTVLTTAIIGAGLASTSGAAFATEGGHHGHESAKSHGSESSCSNLVKAKNTSGAGNVLFGGVAGGDQTIRNLNACNNLNGNSIASGNNFAGGDIHNGNTTTNTKSEQTAVAKGKGASAILSGLIG